MTIFRICQGLGLIASFLTSIFSHKLMTSLYTALVLHVIGFLGLILVATEVANREKSSRNELINGASGNSEAEQSAVSHGLESEAEMT